MHMPSSYATVHIHNATRALCTHKYMCVHSYAHTYISAELTLPPASSLQILLPTTSLLKILLRSGLKGPSQLAGDSGLVTGQGPSDPPQASLLGCCAEVSSGHGGWHFLELNSRHLSRQPISQGYSKGWGVGSRAGDSRQGQRGSQGAQGCWSGGKPAPSSLSTAAPWEVKVRLHSLLKLEF